MTESKRSRIRGGRQEEILGTLIGWIMKFWAKTLRVEVEDRGGAIMQKDPVKPAIMAMWHNGIFIVPPIWLATTGKRRKTAVLTSASKDGAILASAMAVFDLDAVRGSSSRRGVSAMMGMMRLLKEGVDLCITPDGPKGPRYVVQGGAVKLAQASGVPIVPMHVSFSSAWRLKTWDKLVLPKPFSRVKLVFDSALVVPRKLDDAQFTEQVERLQEILLQGVDDA